MHRTISNLITATLILTAGIAHAEKEFTAEERSWWAVQPVADPAVPADGHPIDAFIQRKLQTTKIIPAGQASAEEFIRRAYFDLHGLPPTPQQVHDFIPAYKKDVDAAVSTLIDQLLASPRYGERWAQHWLDVVRYAESDGYREDAFRPDAHRYRDYVIHALNDDKPYDQFIREQLAADEFAPNDPDLIEATGFLRLGVYEWNQRDAEGQREIMINEITNLTGEVFLGVGIGCARCHDHKFDPILQRDYFAMQAFLSSTTWPTKKKIGTPTQLKAQAHWEEKTAAIRAQMDALLSEKRAAAAERAIVIFPEEVQAMVRKPAAERTSYEEQISMLVQRQVDRAVRKTGTTKALKKDKEKLALYQQLELELAAFYSIKPKPLRNAFYSTDTGKHPALSLIKKGDKNTAVDPAFITLLGSPAPKIRPRENTTGRRSALAEWIASTDNPLAARVAVNRIWQHHFGKGLAASPNDFGTLGEPPTHPELLDWLATRFVENGWKTKPLHRLLMTSATYRQTSRHEPSEVAKTTDHSNSLLWRYPPTRLSAEQIRDAMLAISGELKQRPNGGASVGPITPDRSIYVKKIRNTPEPFLHSFDAPAGFDSTPDRQTTTTPTQALLLANNHWPIARARAFAKRLLGSEKNITTELLAQSYRLAWGREATSSELQLAHEFLTTQIEELRHTKPPVPPEKFPNETGLRPIAQNFASVKDITLGDQALWLQPGSRFEQLQLTDTQLDSDTFTIEAVVQLDAIHKNAHVNTLVSRWNGNQQSAGWAFGITSEKSNYKPNNLIIQLIGNNPGGDLTYEVVASDLRVPTGRPVYIAVTIDPRPEGRGTAQFYLKDLSDPNAQLQTANISHNITSGLQNPDTQILIGGHHQRNYHLWDGQVGRLSLTPGATPITTPFAKTDTLDAIFKSTGISGATWLKKPPATPPHDPTLEALTDFCHALLSSNEFLYLH